MADKPLVTFKDEDDGIGPVTSYTAEARPETDERGFMAFPLVEYGTVDLDNGETEHGWMSREAGRQLAVTMGADFEEL